MSKCFICDDGSNQGKDLILISSEPNIKICSEEHCNYYGKFPTCKEKYTGHYKCNICEQQKDTANSTCY
jgi:hypothetical protein